MAKRKRTATEGEKKARIRMTGEEEAARIRIAGEEVAKTSLGGRTVKMAVVERGRGVETVVAGSGREEVCSCIPCPDLTALVRLLDRGKWRSALVEIFIRAAQVSCVCMRDVISTLSACRLRQLLFGMD